MARTEDKSFVVAEVLDGLERATREVGKSLDSMRGRLDYERLGRAREALGKVVGALDALLAEKA
ncbi:MAG: hypothetical protein SCH98_01010 [Deferrisomatales bacterium]|nr:hypothetical protein [Deferrisomatales bacterium]